MVVVEQDFSSNKIAVCTIKFNDCNETETRNIALFDGDENTKGDEDIFFYSGDADTFCHLFNPDNGEDFCIIDVVDII